MGYTILDCYTDEPAGLGVPPYLGTYPRYVAGKLLLEGHNVSYITIDDLRLFFNYNLKIKKSQKTNIKAYNLTKNIGNIKEVLEKTDVMVVILGVHTPGKYLSAVPGTLREAIELTKEIKCKKILTGPVFYGTQLEGGKFFERAELSSFDKIESCNFSYDEIKDFAVKGACIINQIPDLRVIEIETSHGCQSGRCSFCTEPLKYRLEFREMKDVLDEIRECYNLGCRYFRLGKQSCFYSYPQAEELLKSIRKECSEIKVLHIDNVNPVNVISKRGEDITKAIAKYCTSGNVAALGIESFDEEVARQNELNCKPEQAFEAIKILNKHGRNAGESGMPKFLPGINLLFGLKGEKKETHQANYRWLKKILESDLLIRRINIRQVSIFEGTPLYKDIGNKALKKNRRHYWKWRNEIRQKIDFEMLKGVAPIGCVLKEARAEVYDGNTTFCRQLGTYPLIAGVKRRLELGKFYDLRIVGHMLRSVVGEVEGLS